MKNNIKENLKKISSFCKLIFGYGIMLTLLAGGLTFFGYVVALIMGGDGAAVICNVIYEQIFPVIIYISSSTVLFGLVAMYLGGEVALTATKKTSKNDGER